MSLAEDAPERPLGSDAPFLALGSARTLHRLPVYLACTVLALVINYVLGKDMAWDTLNYHLYAGFSAVNDRFAQDYFAAGPLAYVNPYAYVPFYALVASGLSALQIGSLLAVGQSVILWLTFELALAVCPSGSSLQRVSIAICAVALAAVNPVLIQQIGSSFADITTAELVVAGWALLARAISAPCAARVIFAAVMLGAATAFKLTNAVHAIAAAAILMMLSRPLTDKLRYGLAYAIAVALSFAIVAAPWSYRLERRFGNPFFPLLNNVFRSPEFTTEPLRHFRFIPASLAEALWRPFAMLDPVPMVHEELSAPDPRYAVLLVLVCALVIRWAWTRLAPTRVSPRVESPVDARVLAALGCGFAVDWVLWLIASGNSRYFLPMACVGGVLVIGLLFHAFFTRPKVRNYILAVIFGTQVIQLSMGAEFRWNGAPWSGAKWLDVKVPESLAIQPSLYLTMDTQSNSFIAPYLAKDAGLINFSGAYPLGVTGANGARVGALIRQYSPHLRFLSRGERLYPDAMRRAPSVSEINDALGRFGLRADPSDCATIAVRGLPPDLEFTFASSRPAPKRPANTTYLVSCALVPDNNDHSADRIRQEAIDVVLDRLEDACPELFQPRRLPTDYRGDAGRRIYLNTDLMAWVGKRGVKLFFDPARGDDPLFLGREDDWLKAPPRLACARRNGHFIVRVLDSKETR
jgi:hypothetical protein